MNHIRDQTGTSRCPLSLELTPCCHSRLFFITHITTHSVVFLKPTVSSRPSVPTRLWWLSEVPHIRPLADKGIFIRILKCQQRRWDGNAWR